MLPPRRGLDINRNKCTPPRRGLDLVYQDNEHPTDIKAIHQNEIFNLWSFTLKDKGNLMIIQNEWPLEFRNLYHGYRERNSSKIKVFYMLKWKSAAQGGLPEKHEKRRVSKLNRDQCINMSRSKIM